MRTVKIDQTTRMHRLVLVVARVRMLTLLRYILFRILVRAIHGMIRMP